MSATMGMGACGQVDSALDSRSEGLALAAENKLNSPQRR